MTLNSPTIDDCKAKLIQFWGKLTLEQKRNLGKAISMRTESDTIMKFVQNQLANLGIGDSPEFSSALARYNTLSNEDQEKVRNELVKYFLQRNP